MTDAVRGIRGDLPTAKKQELRNVLPHLQAEARAASIAWTRS